MSLSTVPCDIFCDDVCVFPQRLVGHPLAGVLWITFRRGRCGGVLGRDIARAARRAIARLAKL